MNKIIERFHILPEEVVFFCIRYLYRSEISPMKKCALWFMLVIAASMLRCGHEERSVVEKDIEPPNPEQIPHELTAHGTKRIDNYYWMKLSEEQKKPPSKMNEPKKC
jgi:hypothetical protein